MRYEHNVSRGQINEMHQFFNQYLYLHFPKQSM